MNKNKNLGFTLAEVLIVIGIIGVVAALTLPNLNHATGDKETVTRVKKIYSTLTEAFDRAQAIYGPVEEWVCRTYDDDIYINATKQNELTAKRITEFMKISKDCGDDFDSCINYNPPYSQRYAVTLPDGIALDFAAWTCNDNVDAGGHIYVDINGIKKGKNQDGIDIFAFEYYTPWGNMLFPGASYPDDSTRTAPLNDCFNSNYCTEWVVTVGNLDYLKADDEGKCPNGVQLSWTQTSCN